MGGWPDAYYALTRTVAALVIVLLIYQLFKKKFISGLRTHWLGLINPFVLGHSLTFIISSYSSVESYLDCSKGLGEADEL